MESYLSKVMSRLFILSIFSLLFGCQSPINILYPPAGTISEPVTHVTVHFTDKFMPAEGWGVYLDSNKISGFSPTPAPGVTSTAPIEVGYGYKIGPNQGDVAIHDVTTNATCGFFCVYGSEKNSFFPPALIQGSKKWTMGLNVVEFVPTVETVFIQNAAPVPIQVTVTDETKPAPVLRLGKTAATIQSLGIPIVVTIPQGGVSVSFYVQSAGSAQPPNLNHQYDLRFRASGVTPGYGTGNVVSPP